MKYGVLTILIGCCTAISGQAISGRQSLSMGARVSKLANGTLMISADNPRLLWQTIDSVRRRYGWTVDYEDPQLTVDFVNGPVLKGGSFVSHIHEPANNSVSEEQRVLQEIVTQFNAQSPIQYRVLKISDTRFDIAPVLRSALDQSVLIDDEQRSLRAEVDAIMAALTKVTGAKVAQGGLISNSMEQNQVSLKHAYPVPVRQLLNETLNHAQDQKVWIFTCDPYDHSFAIGIQETVKWTTDQDGKISVKTFSNPQFIPPRQP